MTLISIPPTGSKQISFIEGVIMDHLASSDLPIVIANDLTVTGTLNVAGPMQLGSTININADGIAESATRKYLTTGVQTILGAKTFSGAVTFSSGAIITGDITAGILRITSTGFYLYRDVGNDYGAWSYWSVESATGIDSLHGGASHFGAIISGAKSGHLALQIPANGVDDSFFICTNANAANGITDYTPTRRLLQIKNTGDLNFGTAGEVVWTQATKTLSLASDSTLTVPVGKLKLGTVTLTATATELNLLSGVTALHNPLLPKRAPGVYLTSGPTYTVDLANAPECIWCDSTSSIDIVIPEITLSTYGGWRIRIVNTGVGTVWVRFYNADIQHAGGSKTFRGGTPAYSSLTVGNTHGYVLTYNGATTTLEKTYYSQYMHAT